MSNGTLYTKVQDGKLHVEGLGTFGPEDQAKLREAIKGFGIEKLRATVVLGSSSVDDCTDYGWPKTGPTATEFMAGVLRSLLFGVKVNIKQGVAFINSGWILLQDQHSIFLEFDLKAKYAEVQMVSDSEVSVGANEETLHKESTEDPTYVSIEAPEGFHVYQAWVGRYTLHIILVHRPTMDGIAQEPDALRASRMIWPEDA